MRRSVLANHRQHLLVEVITQPVGMLRRQLVGEQRAELLQFSRNLGLAEEGAQDFLFLEGALGGPVALQ